MQGMSRGGVLVNAVVWNVQFNSSPFFSEVVQDSAFLASIFFPSHSLKRVLKWLLPFPQKGSKPNICPSILQIIRIIHNRDPSQLDLFREGTKFGIGCF